MTPVVRHEDRWLVVVDKPAGMAAQPDDHGGVDVHTWATARWGRAALHHRLDRPASGLMVLGLDPRVDAALTAAFRDHRVARTYHAVLAGVAPGAAWSWTAPIEGQPARTHARRLAEGNGMIAVEVTLETGRHHQIRRHAALAGLPIVGDRRYGGEVGGWSPRLALHAARLGFTHPVTGEAVEVAAPLPDDLTALWGLAGAA